MRYLLYALNFVVVVVVLLCICFVVSLVIYIPLVLLAMFLSR